MSPRDLSARALPNPVGRTDERRHRGPERTVTRLAKFEFQAHARSDASGALPGPLDRRLRKIDQLAVMAEIRRKQLRMTVQAKAPDAQPIEVAREEIRQVKRTDLGLRQLREHRFGRVKLIAMGPGNALDALLGEDPVE